MDKLVSLAPVMALLLLAGCGFRPVHGEVGGGGGVWLEALRSASLELPESPVGWQVGRFLRGHQGGGTTGGSHRLLVEVSQSREDLLVQRDSNVIRSSVRLRGEYLLLDARGVELVDGEVLVSAAYNRVGDGFANEAALRNAEERAARELAGRIWRRLVLEGVE